jgi:hypothetical protein
MCAVGVVDSEVKTPKTRFVKPEGGTRTGRPSVPTLGLHHVVMLPAVYMHQKNNCYNVLRNYETVKV